MTGPDPRPGPAGDASPRSDLRLAPHPILPQHYADEEGRREYVTRLFDAGARHYDWINRWMSLGVGHWYRRQALLRAGLGEGMRALDVGCGTGAIADMAARVVGPRGGVVGLDPSLGMLREAHGRGVRRAVQAMGERLPFADASFDLLSMGYALRHLGDLRGAFGEYRRVLKRGGVILLLEITRPRSGLARWLLKGYLKFLVPALAVLFRRGPEARTLVSYYWDTIEHCVPPETILDALGQAGFSDVRRRVELGVLSEYTARKA